MCAIPLMAAETIANLTSLAALATGGRAIKCPPLIDTRVKIYTPVIAVMGLDGEHVPMRVRA